LLFCRSLHRLCLTQPLSRGLQLDAHQHHAAPASTRPWITQRCLTQVAGVEMEYRTILFSLVPTTASPRWCLGAAPTAQLGLGDLTPCHRPQGWCLCSFSFQNLALRAKNVPFSTSAQDLCLLFLCLHPQINPPPLGEVASAHPSHQAPRVVLHGGAGLSASKGDRVAAKCPRARSALLGTAWPGGTPWAVLVRCRAVPDLSLLLELPAGHKSLGGPQEEEALQTGAQTDPGAEKKDGRTQEKTYPLL